MLVAATTNVSPAIMRMFQ